MPPRQRCSSWLCAHMSYYTKAWILPWIFSYSNEKHKQRIENRKSEEREREFSEKIFFTYFYDNWRHENLLFSAEQCYGFCFTKCTIFCSFLENRKTNYDSTYILKHLEKAKEVSIKINEISLNMLTRIFFRLAIFLVYDKKVNNCDPLISNLKLINWIANNEDLKTEPKNNKETKNSKCTVIFSFLVPVKPFYKGMKSVITQNYKNETQTFKSQYFKSKAFHIM